MGAGLAADRWRGVANCGGSYRSGDAGRAGETVPKASCRPCRPLFCPPPRERSGRQTALARVCKLQMALDRRRDDANVAHEKPPCWTNVGRLYSSRGTIELTADELAAVTAAIRRAIEDDRFPHAPRLDTLRAALGKFEAAAEPAALRKAAPQAKPTSTRADNRRPGCRLKPLA